MNRSSAFALGQAVQLAPQRRAELDAAGQKVHVWRTEIWGGGEARARVWLGRVGDAQREQTNDWGLAEWGRSPRSMDLFSEKYCIVIIKILYS